MQEQVIVRAVDTAKYIIRNRCTVREAARIFGVSKATTHIDVTQRLPRIDKRLAQGVREVLRHNLAERHIRGGESTKRKIAQRSSF